MAHPRTVSTGAAARTLERVRAHCLARPATVEKEAWGRPTFRVKDRMFAMFMDDHHGDGRLALWLKASRDVQEPLVRSQPRHFFVPPYVGPKGWLGVRLDRGLGWDRIEALLEEAWGLAAPARVQAQRVRTGPPGADTPARPRAPRPRRRSP